MAEKTNKKGNDDAGFLSRAQARTSSAAKPSLSPRRPEKGGKKVLFSVRLDESVKLQLRLIAAAKGMSIQDMVGQWIADAASRHQVTIVNK